MTKFDEIYQGLIRSIMERGVAERSARTGHETRAIPGVSFSIDLERDGFPLLTLRKVSVRAFIAEQAWFLSGSRKRDSGDDAAAVAYGYRWRKHFGRDQLGELVALLEREPSSRQGVVVAWDPAQDGLANANIKKDAPSPFTFTANVIGERLHVQNAVRSNDMLLGFPADVAGFALLQMILAERLGVAPGVYSHSISHAHVYDVHYLAAEELLRRTNDHQPIRFSVPKNALVRAEEKDPGLVEEITSAINAVYQPLEAIKGLKIVV